MNTMMQSANAMNLQRSANTPIVYLDHHATTPVDPRVARVVFDVMTKNFGNAHSVDHLYGQGAARIVESAAGDVAGLLGADQNSVRFTSGATEGIRLAFAIACAANPRLRVAVSRVEHAAVLEPLCALENEGRVVLRWIEVDGAGRVDISDIERVANEGIDFICLMAANNEVGTIYPIQTATAIAAAVGAEILVDATPAVGRVPIEVDNWGIDYLVLSAHKLYGPKGAGALISRYANTPMATEVSGHVGTLNVPAIAGFGEACRIISSEGTADISRERDLRNRLENTLLSLVPDLIINGDRQNRLDNNLHFSAPGAPNDAVLSRLQYLVAISTGAACSSGAQQPSHVLRAMSFPSELEESALRISPGKFNTEKEIDFSANEIAKAIKDVRAAMRTTK